MLEELFDNLYLKIMSAFYLVKFPEALPASDYKVKSKHSYDKSEKKKKGMGLSILRAC